MYGGIYNILCREEEMDLETTSQLFGPIFLGLLVNYFLWGIQITQSYYYYRSYRKTDRAWLKVAVGSLFIVDAIQSICVSKGVWNAMLKGLGGISTVRHSDATWGLYLTPLLDAITASIVHSFYAQKIWTLLGIPFNYIFTGLVLSLSCLQLVAGVVWTIFFFSFKWNFSDLHGFHMWTYVWLATGWITDIIITSVMTWKLANSRTGFKDTDDIISKLIRLIVETGFATTIVQLVMLVLSLRWPSGTYDFFPGIISVKIYSNSMLALLNSRQPRGTDGVLHIHNGQTIETTINFHTAGSVDIATNFESGHGQTSTTSPPPRSRSEQCTAPDAESAHSLPFRNADCV